VGIQYGDEAIQLMAQSVAAPAAKDLQDQGEAVPITETAKVRKPTDQRDRRVPRGIPQIQPAAGVRGAPNAMECLID
jgi:hypothetical protein